jgi:hypothetical protein
MTMSEYVYTSWAKFHPMQAKGKGKIFKYPLYEVWIHSAELAMYVSKQKIIFLFQIKIRVQSV